MNYAVNRREIFLCNRFQRESIALDRLFAGKDWSFRCKGDSMQGGWISNSLVQLGTP